MADIPQLRKPKIQLRKPKIQGVEVDKDLANAVFLDDMLQRLQEEMATASISFRALLSVVLMFVPGMVGILFSMWSNLQILILQLVGNYTINDMLTWTIGFYFGFTVGPLLSVVMWLVVSHWALTSFQGIVVIRVIARNPSSSKVATIDYMGEMPKPMRKPKLEDLGERFTAFLREQIAALRAGTPVQEVQANLERMQQRFAATYYRQLEKMEGAAVRHVTKTLSYPKVDENNQPVLDEEGNFVMEDVTVQVPVYSPQESRARRAGIALVILVLIAAGIGFLELLFSTFLGFSLLRFIFGFLPIW